MDEQRWRSHERSAEVRTRMTPQDKAEVERRAREAGATVQDYMWAKALDRPYPQPRKAGTARRSSGEELPLTGS